MFCLQWNQVKVLVSAMRKQHPPTMEQESHETFIRTIQVLEPGSAHRSHKFKAVLDAGCLAGDLITLEVIAALGCMDKVQPCDEVLGICLHGDVLKSTGTIDLQWEGTGLYKLFKSRFHVVESRPLAWQIIVGAETCALHSLLTVGAFGGSKHQVFQKKGKKHNNEDSARKDKHKQDVADNAERVARDKAEKKGAKDPQHHGNGEGSSKRR